jgi:CheY-like chemotaxis protein
VTGFIRAECRPIEILMVEDNPGDIRLCIEALKEGKVNNRMHTVSDGEEAWLSCAGRSPMPRRRNPI